MIGIIKENGQLRQEAANILRAIKELNGYATSPQIAAEYKQQHGDQIGKGYLDAVLKEAVTEKLVIKINSDVYRLTPKGELLLQKYPTEHGGGETSKKATPEPKPNEGLARKKVTFSPRETWDVIKALKALNGYAALNQIAAECRRQNGHQIDTGYLSSGLDELANKNLIQKMTAGYYKLLPEGQKFLNNHSFVNPSPAKSQNATASTSSNSNTGSVTNRIVAGSKSRNTSDDVLCPFCKLYYPQGTITCSKCNATIGSTNQKKIETAPKQTSEPRATYIRAKAHQHSTGSKNNTVSTGDVLTAVLRVIGWIAALGTISWAGYSSSAAQDSAGTGSGDTMNGSSSTFGSSSEFSKIFVAEGPVGTTLGFPVTTTVVAVPFATSSTTNPPPIWEDSLGYWHIGDSVPYSIVEKRAEQINNIIHRADPGGMYRPLIVTQSPEHAELTNRLFKSHRVDVVEEKFDLWISLLEHSDHVS